MTVTPTAPATLRVAWTQIVAGDVPSRYLVTMSSTGIGGAYSTPAAGTCSAPVNQGVNPSCDASSLTPGTTYYFKVQADDFGNTGVGAESAAVGATAIDVPTVTPGVPTAAPNGAGSLLVTFTAPTGTTARPVTTYHVQTSLNGAAYVDAGAGTCATPQPIPTPCTVSGLTPGGLYRVRVEAANLAGVSGLFATSVSAVRAIGLPGTPDTPTVTVTGDLAVSVAWTGPTSTTTNPVTSFTVQASSNGGGYAAVPAGTCLGTVAASPCTVTGLTAGNTYQFKVTAVNGAGSGSASAASDPMIAIGQPSTPTAAAISGNGVVRVTWVTPASGATSHIVYQSTSSNGTYTAVAAGTCASPQPIASPCTVTGLTTGTAYFFKVRGFDGDSQGALTAASNSVTAIGAPAVPGTPSAAVRGASALVVTWTAPASPPENPVVSYTLQAKDVDGANTYADVVSAQCSDLDLTVASECVVSGLVAGHQYKFQVIANNAAGTGTSAESTGVTPVALPATPAGNPGNSVTGDRQITVTWTASVAGAGGSAPITHYVVQQTTDAGANWTAVANGTCASNVSHPTATCTATLLTNAQAYAFRVKAVNAAGDSASWSSGVGTPTTALATPGQPAAPTISAYGDRTLTVNWVAPTPGTSLSSYTLAMEVGGDNTFTPVASGPCSAIGGGTTSCVVSNLSGGASYRFKVLATNPAGAGSYSSASTAAVAITLPAAQDKPTVSIANGTSITVAWTGPTATASMPVTSYKVWSKNVTTAGAYVLFVNAACSDLDVNTACTVTGLTAGDSYKFKVAAVNAVGDGPDSAESDAIVPIAAAATPSVSNTGGGEVTLTWTTPTAGATGHVVYQSATQNGTYAAVGAGTCLSGSPVTSPCTVTGLTLGQVYWFKVAGTNGSSQGAWSTAVSSSTVIAVPDAPAKPDVAIAGGTSITVTWTGPTATASKPVDSYKVWSRNVTAAGAYVLFVNAACSDLDANTACTVTGLTAGNSYTFKVQAVNSLGDGTFSPESDAIVPIAGAATPSVEVTNGGEVTLTWTSTAGAASHAVVQSATLNGTYSAVAAGTCATPPPIMSPCTVTGLNLGSVYYFKVAGTNDTSQGAWSTAVASSIVLGAPDAPSTPTAEPTEGVDNSLTVSWTDPASTEDNPVDETTLQKMDVTASGSYVDVDMTDCQRSGEGDLDVTCAVASLTNGHAYKFKVIATNTITSTESLESEEATAIMKPDTPQTPTVEVSGVNGLEVSWVAASTAADAGQPATSYLVQMSIDDEGFTNAPEGACAAPVQSTTCIITSLENGHTYNFTVAAVNAAGASDATDPSEDAVAAGLPGTTSDPWAVPNGVGSLLVEWSSTPSESNPIHHYTVTMAEDEGAAGPATGGCSGDVSATSCTITGLTVGASYVFTVTPVNDAGPGTESGPSEAEIAIGLPDAPDEVSAAPNGDESMLVSWSGVETPDSSKPVDSYRVQVIVDGGSAADAGASCDGVITELSCTITGLTAGSSYEFQVYAVNLAGDSDGASTSSDAVVATGIPGVPSASVNGAGTLQVTWGAPENGTGDTTYRVYSATDADGPFVAVAAGTCESAPASGCEVTGLETGSTYYFKVSAVEGETEGVKSESSAGVMVIAAPGSATAVQAEPSGDRSLHVSWTAPEDTGGMPVDHYTIRASVGEDGPFTTVTGGACGASVEGNVTECEATNLTLGETYRFEVTAVNDAGSAAASESSTAVVAIGPPATPDAPVATVIAEGVIHVEWTAPTITDGTPIASYLVGVSIDGGDIDLIIDGGCSGEITELSCDTTVDPGHDYQFAVLAQNVTGGSDGSELSDAVDPVSIPMATKFADINGDGRADLISFDQFNVVRAYRNVNGIGVNTYGAGIVIGSGWDPARSWFTDLNGDGRAEGIYIDGGGTVRALRNTGGLTSATFTGSAVTLGTGWSAASTTFADINGDHRAEIIYFDTDSNVWAFRNVLGFADSPYNAGMTKIGIGWDKTRTQFADINGDGRAEIIWLASSGLVTAYLNINGLTGSTFGAGLAIGAGWSAENTRFADLTGDGKAEIMYISGGAITAFRNVNGMTSAPFADSNTVAAGFAAFG